MSHSRLIKRKNELLVRGIFHVPPKKKQSKLRKYWNRFIKLFFE